MLETSKASESKQPLLTEEELSTLLEKKPQDLSSEKKNHIVPYNFRCPERISKEQMRSLYLLHDAFARNLASSLPIFLRVFSNVNLISLEQKPYIEYLASLSDPTTIFTLATSPLAGTMLLELSPKIAFSVIDRQLGGQGQALANNRSITEIEKRVLEGFVKLIIDLLSSVWQQVVEMNFQVTSCETSPQLVQIVPANEAVLVGLYQIQIGETQGTISICLPVISLEPIIEEAFGSQSNEAPAEETRALLDNLSTILLPVSAELHGTKASLEEILNLNVGDVIRLDNSSDQLATLTVNGVGKFFAELVERNKRTAVCIKSAIS
jgi:flagellar motor switch protein FliM